MEKNLEFYKKNPEKWHLDFIDWLIKKGVPKKYVNKVAQYCWDQGHAYGYYEVMSYGYSMISIFTGDDYEEDKSL